MSLQHRRQTRSSAERGGNQLRCISAAVPPTSSEGFAGCFRFVVEAHGQETAVSTDTVEWFVAMVGAVAIGIIALVLTFSI